MSTLKRPLFIDFELYADNDPEFKLELIESMVDNLHELQKAYSYSVENKDPQFFSKTYHKVKTTIVMLEDDEFNKLIEELKNPAVDADKVSLFNKLIVEIIRSLSAEKA